ITIKKYFVRNPFSFSSGHILLPDFLSPVREKPAGGNPYYEQPPFPGKVPFSPKSPRLRDPGPYPGHTQLRGRGSKWSNCSLRHGSTRSQRCLAVAHERSPESVRRRRPARLRFLL